jgi:hypothetical protein
MASMSPALGPQRRNAPSDLLGSPILAQPTSVILEPMDPQALYVQLGVLLETMPADLAVEGPYPQRP